jgi:hypothetical protein
VAKKLASLKSSESQDPPIVLIYGNDGVGKTSLAAEFPAPIYLHTDGEETPKGIQLPSSLIESYDDACEVLGELLEPGHDFKTIVLDSLDGLEPLVWQKTCARLGVKSIEEPGYGKGYKEADEEWNYLIGGFLAAKKAGLHVVMLAHPRIKRFDSPVSDPYDRYGIKIHDRASDLVREKSDIVVFMKQRITLKEKEVARQTKVAHGESGGDREMHLEERPGFVAKNRFDMPNRITYKRGTGYAELAKFFPTPTGVGAATVVTEAA